MSAEPAPTLACHRCGYDLRAHDPNTVCPECGTSVAESVREAALPRRPAWRDSDPRWRRRLLAGLWVLVLMPAVQYVEGYGWRYTTPAPDVFGYGAVETLNHTLFGTSDVYGPLVIAIGLVLLFARERSPRGRLDRTSLVARARRIGPVVVAGTLLLNAASSIFIWALTLVGVSHIFYSLPLSHQPWYTEPVARLGTWLIWYGPHPGKAVFPAAVIFACTAVLLGSLCLFDALRRSLPAGRWFTVGVAVLISPLVGLALFHLLELALYSTGIPTTPNGDPSDPQVYLNWLFFRPDVIASNIGNVWILIDPRQWFDRPTAESLKWHVVLVSALWLTGAQLLSYRKPPRLSGPGSGGT